MRSFFFGNALTGTNFKNGELGTIYTEQKFAETSTTDSYTDIGNNKTSEIDARGNETKYEYNSVTSKPTKVTAPDGGTVSYAYNSYDDLTVKDGSNCKSSRSVDAKESFTFNGYD